MDAKSISNYNQTMEVHKMVKAYCMKCKKMSEMAKAVKTKMKNGRMALKGTCAKCGTKMFKIGGA